MEECAVTNPAEPKTSNQGLPGKDGDSSGYLIMNPWPGKVAATVLLFPYRVNVAYLIGNSIDEPNMVYRMGTHAELMDPDLPFERFKGSVTLEKGVLLELRISATDDFAVANFKIAKI